jgi:hypothetical protein
MNNEIEKAMEGIFPSKKANGLDQLPCLETTNQVLQIYKRDHQATPAVKDKKSKFLEKFQNELQSIQSKREGLFKAENTLLERSNKNFPDDMTNASAFPAAVNSATSLMAYVFLREARKLVQAKTTKGYACDDIFTQGEFDHCQQVLIKFNGISIKDIMEKQHSPSEIYQFSIDALTTLTDKSFLSKIAKDNMSHIAQKNPERFIDRIKTAAAQIVLLSIEKPDLLEKYKKLANLSNNEMTVIHKAEEILQRFHDAKEEIFQTLLNPTSPYFLALKNKVEPLLRETNEDVKYIALNLLGLDDDKRIVNGYGIARKEMGSSKENSEFYRQLAINIYDKGVEEKVPCADDYSSRVIQSENLKNEITPSLDELKKIIVSILEKKPRDFYDLNTNNMDWKYLVKPNEASVFISSSGPNKFRFNFLYVQDNEFLEMVFAFNVRRNEFFWKVMENPDDPKLQDARKALFLSARDMLAHFSKQANEEFIEKQKLKAEISNTRQESCLPKPKEDNKPYIPREKFKKPERPRFQSILNILSQQDLPKTEDNKIKNHVSFSSKNSAVKDFMRGLSSKNRRIVYGGVDGINKGIGTRLKAMAGREYEGKLMYEFKAGEFVIIMVDRDTANGIKNADKIHEFEIVEIARRNDAFKNDWKRKH